MLVLKLNLPSQINRLLHTNQNNISTIIRRNRTYCCKVLMVGGGTAGIATAARLSKLLCKEELIIVEPEDIHYYQSCFTWIGAGVKKLQESAQVNLKVFPKNSVWLRDSVACFSPKNDCVTLESGHVIEYEMMVLAMGVKMDFNKIKGLTMALENYRNVSTIYSAKYAEKTFKMIKEFVAGTAVFTSPNTPVKCLTAPLKICYLAQDYLRINDKLCDADFIFATADSDLYPIGKYDELLRKIAKRKRIELHFKTNLIEVKPDKRQVILECLNDSDDKITLDYSLLHVTPPMSPPQALQDCNELVDNRGYADVDLYTLRHNNFDNIFALGDCSPGDKNKTTSAISVQSSTVFAGIKAALEGRTSEEIYNGYTACPVITGYDKCILTEYDYSLKEKNTFPYWYGFESRLMYYIKKYIMPYIYWRLLLRGVWNGTEVFRRILHFEFLRRRR
ncbi:sulfide:quinone oxidoreductase [Holotrichia oblita]|uniref:Sulfide:quinone oxidoreductase n=1 Tax=Holotrichia oblita TaxID=644536 RepID=A0ACB9SPM5_HOLOL|nr:sulfide:quinone oxidoreductase [Holotrichia oblita]